MIDEDEEDMQNKSRVFYTVKNTIFGYVCTIVIGFLGFVNRTALIWSLGANYAGINGLFTNVLGVLSFTELGIGTAFNYSLYKPVAENDEEKIASLMRLYKQIYRLVALVTAFLGMIILPFLSYIVKDPGDIGNIYIYYGVFLFNVVTSYFVSYKYSLVNACQENYLFSVINLVTKLVTCTIQLLVLYWGYKYILYLLVGAFIDLIQKVWVAFYLNHRYPILCAKDVKTLEKAEQVKIWSNVRALIFHKVGDVAVHQTDNIIVSAFIDIATVGKVSYYDGFIAAANQILSVAMNAVVGSLGNALSSENSETSYRLFKAYRFVAFWIYGYAAIGLYILITKLVVLFVGAGMTISNLVVFLIILNFYMLGHRTAINNLKVAGGVFRQDQFLAFFQAIVNLVASIVLVKTIGLPGVYLGTLLQGTLSTIIRPIIVYKEMFHRSAEEYFFTGVKYLLAVITAGTICFVVDYLYFKMNTLFLFVIEAILITIIVNGLFFLLFCKTEEFRYLRSIFTERFLKKYLYIRRR